MDKAVVERYIGKNVFFLAEGSPWLGGFLKEIISDTMIIEYRGEEQSYLLSSITSIKDDRGARD